jgi:hypothetical protein
MEYINSWLDYEANFRGQDAIDWTGAHTEIPVFAITIYLAMVFRGPLYLKDSAPAKFKLLDATWNFGLATFSIVGAARCVPVMISTLQTHGWKYSCCTDPADWYLNGPTGFWTTAFVFSKIPELGDTAFLVMKKKPVIFLHWFHHVTVLLYCWHSFINRTSTGFWFVTMNFSVHAIMYTYYFCAVIGLRHVVKKVAPLITTMQLAQMFVGCFVTVFSAKEYWTGQGKLSCHVDPANFKMGLGMYFSYLCLFTAFFYNLYLAPGARYALFPDKSGSSKKDDNRAFLKPKRENVICGVDVSNVDTAGMFRDSQFKKKPMAGNPPAPPSSVADEGSPGVTSRLRNRGGKIE